MCSDQIWNAIRHHDDSKVSTVVGDRLRPRLLGITCWGCFADDGDMRSYEVTSAIPTVFSITEKSTSKVEA